MTHPLQHLFDESDRRAAEPCPHCDTDNGVNWSQCVKCGLRRDGWLTGPPVYSLYWAWDCPECHCENKLPRAIGDMSKPSFSGMRCDGSCCEYVHP